MFGRKDKGVDPAKVQQTINGVQVPGVRNLSVRQNGETFEIHGQADSIAHKQQAFQSITNELGDASGVVNFIQLAAEPAPAVRPPMTTGINAPQAQPSAIAAGAMRTHTVVKGETLSHIAKQYYGKASMYNRIFEANRDQLDDPDKIRVGQVLKIPT